jgi:asparagine N-glycosylation enzyme membrane subunit Stt3
MVKPKKRVKEKAKEVVREEPEEKAALPSFEGISVPLHETLAAALLISMVIWLLAPNEIMLFLFGGVVLISSLFLLALSFYEVGGYDKGRWNLVPAVIGLFLVQQLMGPANPLLAALFCSYMALSVFAVSKRIKLQTVIMIGLAITAIIFRVYPVLPGQGIAPGHLLSMDDPYYHYKFTEDLYTHGNILDYDYRVYPLSPREAPQLFPYYFNTHIALLSGNSIHNVIIFHPALVFAFGAIMMFLLLKELMGDWKCGLLGGLFYATSPMLLTKSMASFVEQDPFGMTLGVFALYLLVKAVKSEGKRSLGFAATSGVAYLMLLLTWQGFQFLFAVPISALALYALIALVFKYDVWNATRAGLIAGAIPLLAEVLFIQQGMPSMIHIAPFGALLFFGVLSEFLRVRFLGGKDSKEPLEKKLMAPLAILAILALLGTLMYFGPDRVFGLFEERRETFAGATLGSFMVEKTISEQAPLSEGSFGDQMCTGLARYGISMILTLLMLALIPIFLIFYFLKKDKDSLFKVLLPYLIGLVFFIVAMSFVWVQSRLAFSQSLGFIFLGAMAGILLPKNIKEALSLKIIPLLLVLFFIPLATFTYTPACEDYPTSPAWASARRQAGVDPAWFYGVKWLDANLEPGILSGDSYVGGDIVLTWWDYGHFITALSRAGTVTDPLQYREDYIMETARFFYNKTSEDEAMAWLMTRDWNIKENGEYKVKYIILDFSLVGKASALAFLGTNHYEYPNGLTATDGVCASGNICQNIENGLVATQQDGRWTCSEGIVCPMDALTKVTPKMCCEAQPTACCEMTLDSREARDNDGMAALYRSPGTPVFGQYQLNTDQSACRPEYVTSLDPVFFVSGEERKMVAQRFLYTGYSGLPYPDGVSYPAFLIVTYSDGSQEMKFISPSCEIKDYDEVMTGGSELKTVGYSVRLAEDAVAPQVFVHIPQKWSHSMFTELYLRDAMGLKYFDIIEEAVSTEVIKDGKTRTQNIYPSVKIYKINYPDEIPEPGVQEQPASETAAKAGDSVAVEYTGRLSNGTVFDTSDGRGPLEFVLGVGQMIEGFDEAVLGMELGEKKNVTLPPEKAYGSSVGHRLQNETLIFDIELVKINERSIVESPEPLEDAFELNMSFDYYEPALIDGYGIVGYPSLVWNCEYMRLGQAESPALEKDALYKLSCIFNNGLPQDVCEGYGIIVEDGKLTSSDTTIRDLLGGVGRVSEESCGPVNGTSTLQAFYSDKCSGCEDQKPILDALANDFAEYLDLSYYCAGAEAYCLERSGAF